MGRKARLAVAALALVAVCLPVVTATAAQAKVACSAQDPGGAWPVYGADVANSRTQPAETALGPSAAANLAPKWVFPTDGGLQSTPIVSHGCVFLTTSTGYVYAVDAATGRQVWKTSLPVSAPGPIGGDIPGAPAVVGGQLIVLVSQSGAPYAASLDIHNGALNWRSAPVSTQSGVYTNASAAVHDGVVVFGYSPPEGTDGAQGGVSLLDAESGAILADVPTITPADQAQGYAGGGIWSTAAFDKNGYAYVGAGNPFSKTKQDPHTDAILKIDVDRSRPTFGTIVGSYAGEPDQYTQQLAALSQTPACALSDSNGLTWPLDDPVCGQLDLDFGASPNLINGPSGRLLVGDLQKSGVFHAANASDMSSAWHTLVGASCAVCNAASSAYDGSAVYVVGTPGGVLWSLDATTGSVRWETPVADGVHYQSVSTADGVVYTVDSNGFLDVWSAATGAPLAKRSITVDAGAPLGGLTSTGVAIADHTVFAANSAVSATSPTNPPDGYLVAYQP